MGIYIETVILYILLFFSSTAVLFTAAASAAAEFSVLQELQKIILFTIPALALIWYLVNKAQMIEIWIIRPGKKDLKSALLTFPFLLLTGSVVSMASLLFEGSPGQLFYYSPSTGLDWIVICISCILSAYLEESFFRFYILTKREKLNLTAPSALILSTLMFAFCHIGAGPWGFLNAAISGAFFGFMFLRYNSLHGIAIAHALYNITAVFLNV
ncbi:MAG: CPBP family intramembrane metalloprotease [Treponema sp.]|nr:CPBP family intramembrane metalloprotease [Treponema sp.]